MAKVSFHCNFTAVNMMDNKNKMDGYKQTGKLKKS